MARYIALCSGLFSPVRGVWWPNTFSMKANMMISPYDRGFAMMDFQLWIFHDESHPMIWVLPGLRESSIVADMAFPWEDVG